MPKRTDIHKVLIIGSGPIIIGQACEFDYSGTQACKALRKLGYEIVLVNSNPATIMTDPETADVTYIEPLNVERLEQIIAKERPDALLPNLGGQSALNLSSELYKAGILDKYNVKVIGVQVDAIERGEDRVEFKKAIDRPNDYYVEGDEITFTINLKNVGDKRIVNFTLRDELEEFVLPFEAGYEVSTTVGQIASYNKPVMVNNITLKPEEEAIVTITGVIGAIE